MFRCPNASRAAVNKVRSVDVVAQSARIKGSEYELQNGFLTGGEYANTNTFITQKCLYFPRSSDIAVIFMTARQNKPAAIAELRVSKVLSGLPAISYVPPAKEDGDGRTIGVYFEDPAINYDFGREGNSAKGVNNWRVDARREPFIGGGCHAVDLLRWVAGEATEVSAFANHKCLADWPVNDCTIAIYKFANNVIGKVLVTDEPNRKSATMIRCIVLLVSDLFQGGFGGFIHLQFKNENTAWMDGHYIRLPICLTILRRATDALRP